VNELLMAEMKKTFSSKKQDKLMKDIQTIFHKENFLDSEAHTHQNM
jgi:hypothetical protein